MTTFQIKLIAGLTMIIDHVGLFFFPNIYLLRIIGRISFPLFAWLIANGAYHTKNINLYLKRILILALITQPIFLLLKGQVDIAWGLNPVFGLFLGLLAIKLIKKTKDKAIWLVITFICSFLAFVLRVDYGAYGVISIVLFYLFFNNFKYLLISQITIFAIRTVFWWILLSPDNFTQIVYTTKLIQPFGLLSLIFIGLYNKNKGKSLKYFFYIFYPVQYLLIYLANLI
jgi:TraX protein